MKISDTRLSYDDIPPNSSHFTHFRSFLKSIDFRAPALYLLNTCYSFLYAGLILYWMQDAYEA